MNFQDIAQALLSKPNCSLHNVTGIGYIQNLHEYVKTDLLIISKTFQPSKSQKALILKANLLFLLENYDRLDRKPVGYRNKRR